jgi:uncharacterized protein (TIRG00374 family)
VSKRRTMVMSLLLGLGIYALFTVFAGHGQDLSQTLARISPGEMAFILGLSLFNYLIRFGRWHLYLRALGYPVPVYAGLRYYLAGFAFTATPGKMGEAVRSVYLKRRNVPYADSLSVFVVERVSDLLAMLALSLLVVRDFPQYTPVLAIAVAAVALLAVLLRWQGLFLRLRALAPRRLRAAIDRFADEGLALMAAATHLLRTRILITGWLLALIAWGAEGLSLYYILHWLAVDMSVWTVVAIYAVSILIGALSFLPGGLGSTEAAMAVLLVLAGAGQGPAAAATLICRIATLWFAIGLGGVAMIATVGERHQAESG